MGIGVKRAMEPGPGVGLGVGIVERDMEPGPGVGVGVGIVERDMEPGPGVGVGVGIGVKRDMELSKLLTGLPYDGSSDGSRFPVRSQKNFGS